MTVLRGRRGPPTPPLPSSHVHENPGVATLTFSGLRLWTTEDVGRGWVGTGLGTLTGAEVSFFGSLPRRQRPPADEEPLKQQRPRPTDRPTDIS